MTLNDDDTVYIFDDDRRAVSQNHKLFLNEAANEELA